MLLYNCLTLQWAVMAGAYHYHAKDGDNRDDHNADESLPKIEDNSIFENALEILTTSNHKLSADMLYEAVKHHSDSFVISAFSAFSPLSLLTLAASGQTRKELLRALNFDENPDNTDTTENMIRAANVVENMLVTLAKGIQIKTANRIYAPNTFPLNEYFAKFTIAGLDTELHKIDYSPQSVTDINTWVANHTNNKIAHLLGPHDIDRKTQLILVNALYFMGQWASPFDSKNTNFGTFFATEANSNDSETSSFTEIPFMNQQGTFGYNSNDHLDAKILEMKYADRVTDASFVILLPNRPNGLNSLINLIKDPSVLSKALKSISPATVQVSIPKFKIESETDLKEILQEIGVRRVFEPSAELPNIINDTTVWLRSHKNKREITRTTTKVGGNQSLLSETLAEPSPQPVQVNIQPDIPVELEAMLRKRPSNKNAVTRSMDLYVTKAIQKAYISVYETGTEAAAATAILAISTSAGPTTHIKTFKANHPFVFLIRQHNISLFSGVFDPYGKRRIHESARRKPRSQYAAVGTIYESTSLRYEVMLLGVEITGAGGAFNDEALDLIRAANNRLTRKKLANDDDDAVELIMTANDQLSVKMLLEAVKNHTESLVLSAFSVFTPLSLLSLIAEGPGHTEILNALGFQTDLSLIRAMTIENSHLHTEEGIELKTANRIYLPYDIEINEEFVIDTDIVTELKDYDYRKPNKAVAYINNWVTIQTDDKIEYLLEQGDIDTNSKVILVDAIYFKGRWERSFDIANTKNGTFYVTEANQTEVLYMFQGDHFGYSKNDELNVQILEMPYANRVASFVIILPNEINGLDAVQEKIKDPLILRKAITKLPEKTVGVMIPKFAIETTLDLQDILQNIGIKTIFSPEANLSKLLRKNNYNSRIEVNSTNTTLSDSIVVQSSTGTNLFVSKAVHKAVIAVDEDGMTFVAANGATTLADKDFTIQYNLNFKADHPFLFLIKQEDLILFTGVYKS